MEKTKSINQEILIELPILGNLSVLEAIRCKDGNHGFYVCFEHDCQNYPFMCTNKKCTCRKNHQGCIKIQVVQFIQNFEKRLIDLSSLTEYHDTTINKTIKNIQSQIHQMKALYRSQINKKIKEFSFSSKELQLLMKIQQNNVQALKGEDFFKVYQQGRLKRKNQIKFNEKEEMKAIKICWKNIEDKILNQLKSINEIWESNKKNKQIYQIKSDQEKNEHKLSEIIKSQNNQIIKQQKVLSQEIHKINLNLQLGDNIQKQSQTKLKFNVHIEEKYYQKSIEQLKQKGIQLNEGIDIVIQFKNQKPDKSKLIIQKRINNMKTNQQNQLLNQFEIAFNSTKHLTLIQITPKQVPQQFRDIITFMEQKITMQGSNYFLKAQADLFIKSGLNMSLKNKFVDLILNGFHFKTDIECSDIFLKNIKQNLDKNFDLFVKFIELLQKGNVDIQFRTIQNVKEFLAKFGIQLSKIPLLQQIFVEFIQFYEQSNSGKKQLLPLKTLIESILQLTSNKICISLFFGHLIVQFQIELDSFKGISKLIKQNA